MTIRIREFLLYGVLMFSLPFLLGAVIHRVGGGAESDTIQTVFARGSTISTAVSFATALKLLDSNGDGYAWYVDPTNGPTFVCVDNSVENACTSYTRALASGQTLVYKNFGGTAIFTLTEATGALTNTTYNTESAGNVFTYKRYLWLPAGVCQNVTPGTPWDLPAANAAVAACRTGTNTNKGALAFADGSNLTAQYNLYLNEDWTGAIDATIVYEANSTSTNNTVWQIAIACAGDADADDPAFTDDEFTADAGKATAHQYNATAVNTVTTTGTCLAGDMMHLRVRRNSAHASDTLAATALLVGVSLKLREVQ